MNNPQAFPKTPFIEVGTPQNGMTLRDYFAAKAMQALIDTDCFFADVATEAYRVADAMLKARES
jgi:hypothetical protein